VTITGNPSHARWAWHVHDNPAGSRVAVTFEPHPVTFWRRVLLVRVRSRPLARTEIPASLAELAARVGAGSR
jgi:hypothetical protein